jgi:hypothetical protein
MKKALLVLPIIAATILLAGCGKNPAQNENQNQTAQQIENTNQDKAVNSIQEAFNSGKKMKCVYSSTDNGKTYQGQMYIDSNGGKFETVNIVNNQSSYSLFDGESFYTWSGDLKSGMKMSKQCVEDLKNSAPNKGVPLPASATDNPSDFDKNATDVKCETVDEINLTPPAEINFTDNCEMLKKSMEMMKQGQGQMPPNTPAPPTGNQPNL